MNQQAQFKLAALKRRYILLRSLEIVLQSAAIVFLVDALLEWAWSDVLASKALVASLCGVASLVTLFLRHRLHRISNNSFTHFLNETFTSLQQSADLMLYPENELTSLQQLQRSKAIQQFNLLYPSIKVPHHLIRSFGILVVTFLLYLITSSFSTLREKKIGAQAIPGKTMQALDKGISPISIRSFAIYITPPQYTGVKSFTSTTFNLQFPEGSNVRWQIEFSGDPKEVKLFFSAKDSIILEHRGDYAFEKKLSESGFYQIQWQDGDMVHRSDYYQLEVIKDQSPKIELKSLPQFTRLKFSDLRPLQVNAFLHDDYGIRDAILVATVSKGTGEAVKFREEKLPFTSPQKITGRQVLASRALDLKRLGLEPGDELYFYVGAWDNKFPLSNYSRTETFFIAVQDTSTEITNVDSGLGVDLMPEYFRSQRQIIIDTEKLLRDRQRMSKLEFNSTSNELGYDQKVLRLRYGQFLGEEDDAGIGLEAVQQQESEVDVTKQFGHSHDTKNEHNLVQQKKEHDHPGEIKNAEDKEDPIKAFAHSHDNTEEAGFFIQSLKAKLKAAITLMWDAELYLRLYEPDKSLPYQYQALTLLKEISNDSRIYVHRTGFDPPPLKEDKRLTADLSEVRSNTNDDQSKPEPDFPAIRQALNIVELLLDDNATTLSPEDIVILKKAAQEFSIEAVRHPLTYLKALSVLKSLSEERVTSDQMRHALVHIKKSLWMVLPPEPSSPNKRTASTTRLDQEFLRTFEKGRDE